MAAIFSVAVQEIARVCVAAREVISFFFFSDPIIRAINSES